MIRRRLVASVGALLLLAPACGSATPPPPAVPAVFDLDDDPTAGMTANGVGDAEVVPAAELRLLLEAQLGWHGIVLVEAMQGAIDDPTNSVWIDALAANTEDVVGSIGLVYGSVGARAFHQQWAQHTQFLVDYAVAAGRDDHDAADEARRQLTDYAQDSGSLLATATGDRLPVETAREVLRTHVTTMMEQIDAYAAGDHRSAVDLALSDHAYLYGIADALAGAISAQFPGAFPGATDTDFATFCSLANVHGGDVVVAGLAGDDRVEDLVDAADDAIGGPARAVTAARADLLAAVAAGDDAAALVAAQAVLAATDEVARAEA